MEPLKPYYRKAYYYETDKMGIVHHSNYIRWFEEARLDFLEQTGFSYKRMEQLGIQIPVNSVLCQYLNAVRFDDTVSIKLRMEEFNGFRFKTSYQLVDLQTDELKATGSSTHFFVDSDLRPIRTKKAFPDIYFIFLNALNKDLYE